MNVGSICRDAHISCLAPALYFLVALSADVAPQVQKSEKKRKYQLVALTLPDSSPGGGARTLTDFILQSHFCD